MACGSRGYHSWAVYLESVDQRPAIKWSLKSGWILLRNYGDWYAWGQVGRRSFSEGGSA